jgi:hypothetical protein
VEAGVHGIEAHISFLRKEDLGASLSTALNYLIIISNPSISRYLICKRETASVGLCPIPAWAKG